MLIRTNSTKGEGLRSRQHKKKTKKNRNFKNNDKNLEVAKVAEEYLRIVKDQKLSKLNDLSISNSQRCQLLQIKSG